MLRNWLYLIALSVIWGASFMGQKAGLTGFGPLSVAAGRIGLGALVLSLLTLALGKGLPPLSARRVWLHVAGMGLFSNALPFYLLSWGQIHVSSGFAGITMAVVPLFVLPLAHVFVPGERLTRRKLLGFGLGFAGVVLLIGPGAFTASGAGVESLARLACIGAAASYAVGGIVTRLCPPVDQLSFGAGALLVASLLIVPVALILEGLPQAPGATAIAAIAYLGLFPTALATLLLVAVIASAGPSFLSTVNYLVPLWSVLFGTVLLSEALPGQFLGALGLILAGLAISQTRRRKNPGA